MVSGPVFCQGGSPVQKRSAKCTGGVVESYCHRKETISLTKNRKGLGSVFCFCYTLDKGRPKVGGFPMPPSTPTSCTCSQP